MGASVSTLPSEDTISRLTGPVSVASDDSFWDELFSFQIPVSKGATAEESDLDTHAFCTEMVRNNGLSGNFQTLTLRLIELLARMRSKKRLDTAPVQQCCASLFLFRLFLKHMVETLEPEVRTGAHPAA